MSFLKRYDEAEKAYTKGLQLDPENAQLKSGLEEARAMAQRKYYLKILIMSVCFAFSFYHFSVCTVTLLHNEALTNAPYFYWAWMTQLSIGVAANCH